MNNEKGKLERSSRIISAAERLIRETGSTSFSMIQLAKEAGLSTPTTYNLIGSKATVLYILLNSYQDRVEIRGLKGRRSKSPYIDVLKAVDAAVDLYVDDSQFIKPLMLFLIGVSEPSHRFLFMQRAYRYWRLSFKGLCERGFLSDFQCNLLARDFVIYFTGLIDFWVQGELTDEQFRHGAHHASLLRLAGVTDGEDRDAILDELRHSEKLVEISYTS